jgi:hypothetical protein
MYHEFHLGLFLTLLLYAWIGLWVIVHYSLLSIAMISIQDETTGQVAFVIMFFFSGFSILWTYNVIGNILYVFINIYICDDVKKK